MERTERVLFVNACVRKESRTKRLADAFLEAEGLPFDEIRLSVTTFPISDEAFLEERDRRLRNGEFGHPMFDHARRFASADVILIAAPFWDLSFPAVLKQYLEQVMVPGITFRYGPDGTPEGLCRAKALIYVSTAGGTGVPSQYGFGYADALAKTLFGIPVTRLISAEGLDLEGADPEKILRDAEDRIRKIMTDHDNRLEG